MTKPHYKLGDIIRDKYTREEELIIAMKPSWDTYVYKTQYIVSYRDGEFDSWHENTIDTHYDFVGNIFDRGTV